MRDWTTCLVFGLAGCMFLFGYFAYEFRLLTAIHKLNALHEKQRPAGGKAAAQTGSESESDG